MLESNKPGFRAGLLFAGAKTAAERANRMRRFVDELNNQAKRGGRVASEGRCFGRRPSSSAAGAMRSSAS